MNERRQKAWDGYSWYTNMFLRIYDWFALGLNCRFIWRCKSKNIIDLYDKYVSGNHLDAGCGTGFFLEKCCFPTKNPVITLLDLNPYCLKIAERRLALYKPRAYARDVFNPLNIGGSNFDSIGLTHLLHCLPGDFQNKEIVFKNLKTILSPTGIIFGSTFVAGETGFNILTKVMFRLTNRLGFMSNINDTAQGLSELLKRHFSEYGVDVIGCEAVFWARYKK